MNLIKLSFKLYPNHIFHCNILELFMYCLLSLKKFIVYDFMTYVYIILCYEKYLYTRYSDVSYFTMFYQILTYHILCFDISYPQTNTKYIITAELKQWNIRIFLNGYWIFLLKFTYLLDSLKETLSCSLNVNKLQASLAWGVLQQTLL